MLIIFILFRFFPLFCGWEMSVTRCISDSSLHLSADLHFPLFECFIYNKSFSRKSLSSSAGQSTWACCAYVLSCGLFFAIPLKFHFSPKNRNEMKLRQSLWLVPLTCFSPPWPFKPLPLCWAVCVVLALVFVCYRIICLVLTYFFGLKSLPCGATNHHLNSSFFSESLDSILCRVICLAVLFQKHSPRSALSLAWIYPKILWEMLGDVEKEKQRTLFNVLSCTWSF